MSVTSFKESRFGVMIEPIISIFLVLCTVAYFTFPEKWGVFYFFINTPPLFVFAPIAIFAAYAFLFKRKIAKIALLNAVIFVILSIAAVRPHLLGPQLLSQDIKREQPIQYRICSWNTAYFFEFNRTESFNYLAQKNCDIILLQEVWRSDLLTIELEQYKTSHFPEHELIANEEFVIIYPKTLKLLKQYESEYKGHFAVGLSLPGEKSVIIINAHIWNPIVPRPFYTEIDTVAYLDGQKTRELEQTELINFVNSRASENQRIVLMGDFNTTQNNEFFAKLTAPGTRLQHTSPLIAIAEPIWSKQSTYPASSPFLRLDYAFVSKPQANRAELKKECRPEFADHCLMILEVLL